MFEKQVIIDPGAYEMKLLESRSLKQSAVRTCFCRNGKEIIVGKEAQKAYWENSRARMIYPLHQSIAAKDTVYVIDALLDESRVLKTLLKPSATILLPEEASYTREFWVRALQERGFRKVSFLAPEEVLKLEYGIVIDAGFSSTDIYFYHDYQLIESKKLIFGGQQMDEAIVERLAGRYKALVHGEDACELKNRASAAFAENRNPVLSCAALDYTSRFVRLHFPAYELWKPMESVLSQIVLWIKDLIAKLPSDIKADLLSTPIFVCGAMAECYGLKDLLESELNTQVEIAPDPGRYVMKKAARSRKRKPKGN